MGRRRTDEEIAADHEKKAAALRARLNRRRGSEENKTARSLLAASRAIRRLVDNAPNQEEKDQWLVTASDMERAADSLIGQTRVDAA